MILTLGGAFFIAAPREGSASVPGESARAIQALRCCHVQGNLPRAVCGLLAIGSPQSPYTLHNEPVLSQRERDVNGLSRIHDTDR